MNIAVVGLGNVGIPVAAAFAGARHEVVGIDVDPRKVEAIRKGESPLPTREPELEDLLSQVVGAGALQVASGYEGCEDARAILLCVDTPVASPTRAPDYHALETALGGIAPHLRTGDLVSVESTLAPGTMRERVQPALEAASTLRVREDFHLVHCPERVTAGRLLANLAHLDRVVGGEDRRSREAAIDLYREVCQGQLLEADWLEAEVSKTVENAYRDVQLAFANEVALICQDVGADVFAVRELVNSCPGRAMLLPGPGVGGHCIAKDTWLLASASGQEVRLLGAAREVNEGMVDRVVALIRRGLEAVGQEMRGSQITLLGGAYRENVAAVSNSPGLRLYTALKDRGAEVRLHDPHVREVAGIDLWRDLEAASQESDCLVLVTPHDEYGGLDWASLMEGMNQRVVVDCRGFVPREFGENPANTYLCLGRGRPRSAGRARPSDGTPRPPP